MPAVRLVTAPRPWPRPSLPLALAAVWLALVTPAVWLAPPGAHRSACLFRNLTGVPCPTCGSGRAVRAAAEGRLLDAVALSPVTAAASVLGLLWLALRMGLGRRLELDLPPRARAVLWAAAAMLLGADWIWVIASQTMRP